MHHAELYAISDAARRSGLTVSAVRFYADRGVVEPTGTNRAGHRMYGVDAVARPELVRTLRELGPGLDDIRRRADLPRADLRLPGGPDDHVRAVPAVHPRGWRTAHGGAPRHPPHRGVPTLRPGATVRRPLHGGGQRPVRHAPHTGGPRPPPPDRRRGGDLRRPDLRRGPRAVHRPGRRHQHRHGTRGRLRPPPLRLDRRRHGGPTGAVSHGHAGGPHVESAADRYRTRVNGAPVCGRLPGSPVPRPRGAGGPLTSLKNRVENYPPTHPPLDRSWPSLVRVTRLQAPDSGGYVHRNERTQVGPRQGFAVPARA
ncbi:MerR family transcriptional regulator [Streptomyces olivaceus]|nr:MerR family transcriptional regulator [Streptomyces olivaceus]